MTSIPINNNKPRNVVTIFSLLSVHPQYTFQDIFKIISVKSWVLVITDCIRVFDY